MRRGHCGIAGKAANACDASIPYGFQFPKSQFLHFQSSLPANKPGKAVASHITWVHGSTQRESQKRLLVPGLTLKQGWPLQPSRQRTKTEDLSQPLPFSKSILQINKISLKNSPSREELSLILTQFRLSIPTLFNDHQSHSGATRPPPQKKKKQSSRLLALAQPDFTYCADG